MKAISMAGKSSRAKGHAFTLLELLIVIATISMLVAILMPALIKTKSKVLSISCANNLKQISVAEMSYAQDYNDWMARHSYMLNSYFGYRDIDIPNITNCPACSFKRSGFNATHYGQNWYVFGDEHTWTGSPVEPYFNHRVLQFKKPSLSMIIMDGYPSDGGATLLINATSAYLVAYDPLVFRHSSGINALFVDGHVAYFNALDVPLNASAEPGKSFWLGFR